MRIKRIGFYLAKEKMKWFLAIAVLVPRGMRPGLCRPGQRRARVDKTRYGSQRGYRQAGHRLPGTVLDQDYTHYRPHGDVENRAQYLEDRKSGHVDFDSLVADDIKARVYGDTAIVTYPPPRKERIKTEQ